MRPNYHTRQRELIHQYLRENREKHITAEELADHLKAQGNPVGKATIYRYLDKLTEEQVVRRFQSGTGLGACFQYIGEDTDCKAHYHLVCSRCSTLFHVECASMDHFFRHLHSDHRFTVDPVKTVLYGLCDQCSGKDPQK